MSTKDTFAYNRAMDAGKKIKEKGQIIVFTDLDGTLLSVEDYSFEPAKPALAFLHAQRIPVILTTSKTRPEVEVWQQQLDLSEPFIVENGGAIYIRQGYFHFDIEGSFIRNNYQVIELGTFYPALLEALGKIRQKSGAKIRGYGDMSIAEVANLTGLSQEEALLSKKREYDEPFIIPADEADSAGKVAAAVKAAGLSWTRGDRFHHLTGDNDKGRACRILAELFRGQRGDIITIGVGDSLNDLPLLAQVDYPVLVMRPDGGYCPGINLPRLIRSPAVGPAGFNHSILELMHQLGLDR